jgi:hypothetical protein
MKTLDPPAPVLPVPDLNICHWGVANVVPGEEHAGCCETTTASRVKTRLVGPSALTAASRLRFFLMLGLVQVVVRAPHRPLPARWCPSLLGSLPPEPLNPTLQRRTLGWPVRNRHVRGGRPQVLLFMRHKARFVPLGRTLNLAFGGNLGKDRSGPKSANKRVVHRSKQAKSRISAPA